MNKQDKIDDFIDTLIEDFGILPKFAYNNAEFENKVLYSGPYFDKEELSAIIHTLIFGKWFSSGENVHAFENAFSKKFNLNSSVMVNSGSSANLIMMATLKKYFNWDDQSEIIVSVVGFPTTLSAIITNNLVPIFVDIEMDSLNFDINKIEEKITDKTKAIFISPVLGNPPNMDALLQLKDKYNIELILDNCDSLGSRWNDKYLNEYSIASSCSFYPAHHITTGEGGMVSSNNTEIIKIARSMVSWGRDCYCIGSANLLSNGTCKHRFSNWLAPLYNGIVDHKYVFTNIGYNVKPLDIQGSMGLVQLNKFDKIYKLRRKHKEIIGDIFLDNISVIKSTTVYDNSSVSWFGIPFICDSGEIKDRLVKHLEGNGIQTRNYFAGNILIHPAYKKYGNWENYPIANQVLEKVFFVGCSPHYTDQTFQYIKKIIKEFV